MAKRGDDLLAGEDDEMSAICAVSLPESFVCILIETEYPIDFRRQLPVQSNSNATKPMTASAEATLVNGLQAPPVNYNEALFGGSLLVAGE
jgi:hypothetical protein